jgi:putative oxidoreductase
MSLGRYVHAILRIGAGLLFFEHGLQKILGWLGGVNGSGLTVPVMSTSGLLGCAELVGGGLLLVGVLTRPTAAWLAIQMLAVYALAHAPKAGWPIQNQGELPLLYAFVFAYLAANGPGPLSIEELLFSVKLERRRFVERRHEAPALAHATMPAPAPAFVMAPRVAMPAMMTPADVLRAGASTMMGAAGAAKALTETSPSLAPVEG